MFLGPRPMPIRVYSYTSLPYYVYAKRTDSIASLKSMIAREQKIPVDKVVLSNCSVILQNDKNIDDYELKSMRKLYFSELTEKALNIYVKTANTGDGMIFLHVEKGDTVQSVKEKIQKHLKFKLRWQSLYFQGKFLKDEWTLEECGIKESSILDHQMRIGP